MKREGELFIGQKYMENEVTPLFRNEANQLVPRVIGHKLNDPL